MSTPEQPALEGLEPPEKPSEGRYTPPPAKASLGRYNAADPYKCDKCVQRMIEGGKWSAPPRATYRLTENGKTAYLCVTCATEVRPLLKQKK